MVRLTSSASAEVTLDLGPDRHKPERGKVLHHKRRLMGATFSSVCILTCLKCRLYIKYGQGECEPGREQEAVILQFFVAPSSRHIFSLLHSLSLNNLFFYRHAILPSQIPDVKTITTLLPL
jgi:hypothetical protein